MNLDKLQKGILVMVDKFEKQSKFYITICIILSLVLMLSIMTIIIYMSINKNIYKTCKNDSPNITNNYYLTMDPYRQKNNHKQVKYDKQNRIEHFTNPHCDKTKYIDMGKEYMDQFLLL